MVCITEQVVPSRYEGWCLGLFRGLLLRRSPDPREDPRLKLELIKEPRLGRLRPLPLSLVLALEEGIHAGTPLFGVPLSVGVVCAGVPEGVASRASQLTGASCAEAMAVSICSHSSHWAELRITVMTIGKCQDHEG